MTATNRWSPVTVSDRPVDPNGEPIDFVLTAAERDIAVLAKLDILAMKAAQRGGFPPGLEVKRLDPSELTDEQRKALGLEGV